jgi:hypothetical protein
LPEPDTNTHADNSDTNTDANNSDSDANSDAGDTDTYANGDNHTTTAFADTDTKRDSAAADTKATANAVPSAYAVSDRVEELQELKVIRNSRGNSRVPCFYRASRSLSG